MATHVMMSAEQFDRLPAEEGLKYELLDGELIEVSSPTPKHNMVLLTIAKLLDAFLQLNRAGVVIPETEFALGDRRLRPDLAVLLGSKWSQIDLDHVPVPVTPDLVVEIVSPAESSRDLLRKVEAYLNAGVAEVAEVHANERIILVHSAVGIRRLRSGDSLTFDTIPEFSEPLAAVFARI